VVTGDATTQADNEAAVRAALDAFGGLDTLVNCVGIFDFYRGLGQLDASAANASLANT
jgi:2,3-dihydroxy-2,3-dihydrophenylpropionate dehydrogenase